MRIIHPAALNQNIADLQRGEAVSEASIKEKYLSYAEGQSPLKVYWLMKVILLIPCVMMSVSIFAVAAITPNYLWFVALSMLLFFGNLITHVAELESTVYVPLFHLTIALIVVIPFIVFLVH